MTTRSSRLWRAMSSSRARRGRPLLLPGDGVPPAAGAATAAGCPQAFSCYLFTAECSPRASVDVVPSSAVVLSSHSHVSSTVDVRLLLLLHDHTTHRRRRPPAGATISDAPPAVQEEEEDGGAAAAAGQQETADTTRGGGGSRHAAADEEDENVCWGRRSMNDLRRETHWERVFRRSCRRRKRAAAYEHDARTHAPSSILLLNDPSAGRRPGPHRRCRVGSLCVVLRCAAAGARDPGVREPLINPCVTVKGP